MDLPLVVWIGETKHSTYDSLNKHYTVCQARSGRRGLELAQQNQASLVVIDAISLKTNATRICQQLRQALPKAGIVLLRHQTDTHKPPADIVVVATPTWRKVHNQLQRLFKQQKRALLTCGGFALDLENRRLHVRGEEIALNPKQAALIEVFFARPNEVIERDWLMKHVWNTDYTKDTRTLNVHIRWVREALEGADKKTPRHLKTVRGVGYCLEI